MSRENLVLKRTRSAEGTVSGPVVSVSAEADRYAREHGLAGSLRVMKSLIQQGPSLIESIHVDLARDPEVTGDIAICFSILTAARVSDILEFDRRLRDSMFDAIPSSDRAYFAVRYDFEQA